MKKEINELCDLVLDFGEKLYPLLYALKEECGDKPIPEFISEETKRDIADIKRMLAKQMAKESFQAPAYLDCRDDEDEDNSIIEEASKILEKRKDPRYRHASDKDDEDNYGDCVSEPIIEEADDEPLKKPLKKNKLHCSDDEEDEADERAAKKKKRYTEKDEDEDIDIENSRSFSLRQDHMLAVADLSRIDRRTVQEYLNQEVLGTWFFFNRLNVPKGMRRKGIARKLLYKVSVWADKNQYNILNVVSPSGDLTMKQLTSLYESFGFEKISRGLMVRKHVVHVENIYDDVEEEKDYLADDETQLDWTDRVDPDKFINDQEKQELFNGHLKGK